MSFIFKKLNGRPTDLFGSVKTIPTTSSDKPVECFFEIVMAAVVIKANSFTVFLGIVLTTLYLFIYLFFFILFSFNLYLKLIEKTGKEFPENPPHILSITFTAILLTDFCSSNHATNSRRTSSAAWQHY